MHEVLDKLGWSPGAVLFFLAVMCCLASIAYDFWVDLGVTAQAKEKEELEDSTSEKQTIQELARSHADRRAAEVIDIEEARRAAHRVRRSVTPVADQMPLDFDEETDRLAESMAAEVE